MTYKTIYKYEMEKINRDVKKGICIRFSREQKALMYASERIKELESSKRGDYAAMFMQAQIVNGDYNPDESISDYAIEAADVLMEKIGAKL